MTTTFAIDHDFLLDGRPFKILSGAIHYFRVHPAAWYHSLYNLKALGFNTVETYVPWNLHEPREGEFDFTGMLAVQKFLAMAQGLGLYAIVRPAPYICAEWEFGGLPAWLLPKQVRLRTNDPRYLEAIDQYYAHLMPELVAHQVTHGGNILMMQVENEYGSYGEDHAYLKALRALMRKHGVDVPLFTADGPWPAALNAGSLIDEGVLATGNFGSAAAHNFARLAAFHHAHGRDWPLMCMEFWDGWFSRWGEPVVRRAPADTAAALREVINRGSVNLYMFHGGTNFGFMNGTSARLAHDLPQVTSYDYDAPLNEQGNPTPKYFAIQQMVHEVMPLLPQKAPLVKATLPPGGAKLTAKVSLLEVLDQLAAPISAAYPQPQEALGQTVGYTLYRAHPLIAGTDKGEPAGLRVIDARDRVQVFLDRQPVGTQYQEAIGAPLPLPAAAGRHQLDLLVENMGRVNYGPKLGAITQQKGIRTGVMVDLHFITGFTQYVLDLKRASQVAFTKAWRAGEPGFYRYQFELAEPLDTYLDTRGFGKGVMLVNGVNVGRFWDRGPTLSLYVPAGMLHQGVNEVIVFETEGRFQEELHRVDHPIYEGTGKKEE
ncbi:beta-galactosidase family protein [Lacticaseibacillus jixianensis]|uniref:Beta-galactosidase family protein n=1 Tax=Lacticaseibacillus jixianensis TaxID=2486012 RepID=A0ABW4BET9_9LACO|nr:beta-galactosidase family protein [Lacticaseibacillus jixianensis]